MAQPFEMTQYPNLRTGFFQGKLDYQQIAAISAAAIAAGESGATTTVQKFLLANLPAAGSDQNYAWEMAWIGKKVPFTVSVNLKIVNEAGVVIAGPSAGITFGTADATGHYVPMPCAQPSLTTSYAQAYLLVTLASSTFALQTSGALDLCVRTLLMGQR